jgi:hypothetical protein
MNELKCLHTSLGRRFYRMRRKEMAGEKAGKGRENKLWEEMAGGKEAGGIGGRKIGGRKNGRKNGGRKNGGRKIGGRNRREE